MWIYESIKIYEYVDKMTQAERLEFYIDPKIIDWELATKMYIYGL
jgi:hypothetical protein